MLPRCNRFSVVWTVLVVGLIFASPVRAGETDVSAPFPGLIRLYQDYISPVDGHRCPMAPSCSTYANRCIQKHGLLIGWIMGLDRWVRCGRDEVKTASQVWIKGKKYTFDPVENNDFWWSDK
ncbi:membrane protein insertion efficiency factor YidD [Desulfobacula sp.]|uniref:membrane protein insertion efficiency factor YidD n=1 Tax=Desulfobacula sp. TaxID=2593537 RepID=UPI0026338A81|nr:membrane protein insertion efficiency factor YidD [Desulfobacula sp.]